MVPLIFFLALSPPVLSSLCLLRSLSLSLSVSFWPSLPHSTRTLLLGSPTPSPMSELDEDDNEHVDLREFWREIQGAKEMRLS